MFLLLPETMATKKNDENCEDWFFHNITIIWKLLHSESTMLQIYNNYRITIIILMKNLNFFVEKSIF